MIHSRPPESVSAAILQLWERSFAERPRRSCHGGGRKRAAGFEPATSSLEGTRREPSGTVRNRQPAWLRRWGGSGLSATVSSTQVSTERLNPSRRGEGAAVSRWGSSPDGRSAASARSLTGLHRGTAPPAQSTTRGAQSRSPAPRAAPRRAHRRAAPALRGGLGRRGRRRSLTIPPRAGRVARRTKTWAFHPPSRSVSVMSPPRAPRRARRGSPLADPRRVEPAGDGSDVVLGKRRVTVPGVFIRNRVTLAALRVCVP